jgi:hypothetical protein
MANLLSYTDYDFSSLVLQIQNRLKNKEAWLDTYRSGTGEMLIEFLAYVLNLGLFYTERRAEESYILTAKNVSSIRNLVALLNYQPKRKTSATGNLTFSIPFILTKSVYIPKYTECQTSDGLKFITNESAAIGKGLTSVSISSVQGELIQKEITSDGSTDQEYLINDTNVENSASTINPTLRVIISGAEWTKVDSFIYSSSVDKHFRVITEMEGTASIKFGDDVNGKSPGGGSVITIQYVKSSGLAGNVTYTGKITAITSTIYDEDGAIVSNVSVTNLGSFLGGDDEEDIEEIRYEAPRVFKTGDRAVTKEDFTSILENYPGVADANVWGENEEAAAAVPPVSAVHEMLNKVKMCVILQEWGDIDDDFKETLSDYIYNKSMLTVKYEFITPVKLLVIPTLIVKVTTGYSISQTGTDISGVLEDQFKLGDTTKLGTIIKYSKVISAIQDLDSVAYCSMTLEIKKVLSSTYDSVHDFGATLDATSIKPESVRLFINGTYVTVDTNDGDGTGTFSSAGGYIISGDINYSTGVLTVNISGSPASVFVRYVQDADSNIIPSFQQIAKLDSIDKTISME